MFERDEETLSLLRSATAFADQKDWDSAIACLRDAKLKMVTSNVQFTNQDWCKLPLYLSRASRFDEAFIEFDWLVADLPRRARQWSFMDDPNISFGRGETKKRVYSLIIKNAKKVIEEKRAIVTKRKINQG